MSVETIGDAFALGWRVTVRCSYGRSDGPRSQSSRECNYRKELDMETLVWTRGRAFPLSRLESRLRCPRCGSRNVVVLYRPPSSSRRRAVAGARFSAMLTLGSATWVDAPGRSRIGALEVFRFDQGCSAEFLTRLYWAMRPDAPSLKPP